MDLPSYFKDFLRDIRLTETQRDELKRGHEILRDRLTSDSLTKNFIQTTFLQGSYRRHTAVRPNTADLADVDVVVVTSIDKNTTTPHAAMKKFQPFMDKYYSDKYEYQSRSIGIRMSTIKLDLVPTSLPPQNYVEFTKGNLRDADFEDWDNGMNRSSYVAFTEAARGWQDDPLWIPDRDLKTWEETHPLAQILWTFAKNSSANGHYVNVVKCLKWWRRVTKPEPKYPKSYPLEHLIGQCCPNGIQSVGEGVTRTLEEIAARYREDVQLNRTPILHDHGVPSHNVFARVSVEDFARFHANISEAAIISRKALDSKGNKESADLWRQLFGSKFPAAPDSGSKNSGGYTPRTCISELEPGRFA